ncbi:hypothetical protein G6F56_003989 [Rhizopus delemar]|nr:hypothetical protein G6F56_003989 [Rhizopus delemar]
MNFSTPYNATTDPLGLSDTHGSLYKVIGVTLAIASGIFIGSSFVFKKKGLIQSTEKTGGIAGEGYSYLKSTMWWSGMILMVVGEACNFVAYAFTQAILVTPLGALSVVISAVLSSIFLKETLSFQGKVGCLQCVLGAIIIVMHAPEQGSADTSIEAFKTLMLSAVVFTQGLGGAIVHSFAIENQFTHWFVYLVLALTLITLAVEIIYLNKALNLFNTAVVTPTYYVIFTTLSIISSIVFYRGFDASPVNIITCVFGFLIICSGVALLQQDRNDNPLLEDMANRSDISNNQQERLLYQSEKYFTSEEDLHELEEGGSDSSRMRRVSGREHTPSLWHRNRNSLEYPLTSSPTQFTDNINLNTINRSSLTVDTSSTRESVDILLGNTNRRVQDTPLKEDDSKVLLNRWENKDHLV